MTGEGRGERKEKKGRSERKKRLMIQRSSLERNYQPSTKYSISYNAQRMSLFYSILNQK